MNRDRDVAVRFERVSKSIGATCILEDVSFEGSSRYRPLDSSTTGSRKNGDSEIVDWVAETRPRQNIH
jgi:hypothetical protein